MANRIGGISRVTREWGSKAIKQECRDRGLRRHARIDAINEQLAGNVDSDE